MAEQYDDDFNTLADYDNHLPEQHHNRWELDFETDLGEFRYSWRNRIHPRGMEFILSAMRVILLKSNALSNFKDEHINQLGKNYMRPLSTQLLINCRNWKITPSDRLSITSQLSNITVAHLRRAYKDGERKYRQGAYKINVDDDDLMQESSGGGMLEALRRKVNKKKDKKELGEGIDDDYMPA